MDFKNISTLSDNQLIELYRNPIIIDEVKRNILSEIERRDLESLHDFQAEEIETFDVKDKLNILFISPLLISTIILFILFHHLYLKNWNKIKYALFWKYTSLGIVFYTVLFFLWLYFKKPN